MSYTSKGWTFQTDRYLPMHCAYLKLTYEDNMQDFMPTKDCPRLPDYLAHMKVGNPFPHVSNDDVDMHLAVMMTYPGAADLLPKTQYGRRIAVKFFLKE